MSESATHAPIRTFFVAENRLLREALARLFRKVPDFCVVGEAEPRNATPAVAIDGACDILLADRFLLNPASRFVALKQSSAALKIILLDMDFDEQQFLAAVRLGVRGYLLKDVRAADVVAAARAVSRGEAVCPPQLCSVLFDSVAQAQGTWPRQESEPRPDLTIRQQQLAGLIAQGLTNKEIASQLNLSAFTVRNHIHRIMKQVDAGSRSQAVASIRAYGYVLGA